MKRAHAGFAILILWLLATFLSIQARSAQTPTGSIDVYVVDMNGAMIIGATVTCENEGTGYSDECRTDDNGYCRVKNLPVGTYTVRVSAPSFDENTIPRVSVIIANETQIQASLKPSGLIGSSVTVSADVSTVELQSTAQSTTITQTQISQLPINGRRFYELALLAPGVASSNSGAGATNSSGSLSANGSRARSNNFVVDGLDVNDSYRRATAENEPDSFGTTGAILPTEAVQEFVVSTNFATSFGHSTGATINIATKSGTNEFHGSLFEFFGNDALSARNFFNTDGAKNKLRFNDFGFSLGGPIKKGEAFFFTTYEGQRERRETTTVSSVPTDSDFTQAIIALGGNPAIPLAQNPAVNPVVRNLFQLCRVSARCPGGTNLWPGPTPARSNQVLNSLGRASGYNQSDKFVVKVDVEVNRSNRLSGYYSYANGAQSFPLALAGGDELPNTNTRTSSRSQVASVAYSWNPSSNKVNELRVGWTRYTRRFLDDDQMGIANPAQTIGLNTGVTNPRDFGLPHLVVRDFSFLGASPFSNPRGRVGTTWHLIEAFNWLPGRNDLKFGYQLTSNSTDSFNDVNFRGKLEFASLQDFLSGNIRGGSILRGNSDRITGQNLHSIYFQDTFRFGPRFTLNFGERWDYFAALHEDKMLLSNYDPANGLVVQNPLYERDLNNFATRAGAAWSLTSDEKTVLRAGAGLYFDPFPQDFFVGQIQFNTFNSGVAYNPIAPEPILTSRSPTGTIQPGQPVFPAATFATDSKDASTVAKISTPNVLNYTVNIQRELFSQTVLQIGYAGSQGRKLFRTRDINAPLSPGGPRPFDTGAILSSVAPNHPLIVNQIETSAASNYNSLQISLNQRWHGLSNNAQWTWSHSIDDASDGVDSVPNLASPDNPRAPARERANSNFDTRHRFVWGFVYDATDILKRIHLPKRWQGWQIAGILTLSSGQPYSVHFGDEFDSQGAYDFILRPDVVGNPLFGTASPDRLLNLAAFAVPCTLDGNGTNVSNCLPGTLHFGNLPRNAFLGPDFRNFDFSISKTTNFSERVRLEFRAEFFNLTNHPNFSSPLAPRFIGRASLKGIDLNGRGGARGTGCNTAAASTDCYLPSSRTSKGPRSTQLSLKLTF